MKQSKPNKIYDENGEFDTRSQSTPDTVKHAQEPAERVYHG